MCVHAYVCASAHVYGPCAHGCLLVGLSVVHMPVCMYMCEWCVCVCVGGLRRARKGQEYQHEQESVKNRVSLCLKALSEMKDVSFKESCSLFQSFAAAKLKELRPKELRVLGRVSLICSLVLKR